MKVLCLHAYGQNGQMFREATGSFKKLFKGFNFEYIFVDAPHKIEGESAQFSWYSFDSSDQNKDPDHPHHQSHLEQSLEVLRQLFETHQPDGVIGFSQGAAIFSLLCVMEPQCMSTVKFALLFGARPLPRLKKSENRFLKSEIPVLIIHGEADNVIDCKEGENLAGYFNNGIYLLHSGGHYVPSNKDIKSEYLEFLKPLFYQNSS